MIRLQVLHHRIKHAAIVDGEARQPRRQQAKYSAEKNCGEQDQYSDFIFAGF